MIFCLKCCMCGYPFLFLDFQFVYSSFVLCCTCSRKMSFEHNQQSFILIVHVSKWIGENSMYQMNKKTENDERYFNIIGSRERKCILPLQPLNESILSKCC